jgi:hypothetical protein
MHAGGWAGLRPDEVPAILQCGERVLSRREVAGAAQAQATVVRIDLSPDLEARVLRRSQTQAVEITRDGIRQYDRLALPARASQIAADPGVTG